VLVLTLADPDRQWTNDELAERTGEPYPTVVTEVRRLEQADLLTATTVVGPLIDTVARCPCFEE
jgi:DNA-binding MarR family transcriptional regulator